MVLAMVMWIVVHTKRVILYKMFLVMRWRKMLLMLLLMMVMTVQIVYLIEVIVVGRVLLSNCVIAAQIIGVVVQIRVGELIVEI